jgi:hypothetical protein
MNDLDRERRLLHDVTVVEHLDAVGAGIRRSRYVKPADINLRHVNRQPALTVRGTPRPSPSGASLDVNVTIRVRPASYRTTASRVPPGPTMPDHVSVTGDVVVVGLVGVSDPHADTNAADGTQTRNGNVSARQ